MDQGQHRQDHQDLYQDARIVNQLSPTSPDVSSNRNPPERCTGALYSQDCLQEDPTIPHHYQGEELIGVKVETKEEEEETYVRSDQQSMEEGGMIRTIKEEEVGTYLRSDQRSMEKGDMMRTSKEEDDDDGTYDFSGQQCKEEDIMMVTIKEEDLFKDKERSLNQYMQRNDFLDEQDSAMASTPDDILDSGTSLEEDTSIVEATPNLITSTPTSSSRPDASQSLRVNNRRKRSNNSSGTDSRSILEMFLQARQTDEFDCVGQTMAKKLRNLDPDQRAAFQVCLSQLFSLAERKKLDPDNPLALFTPSPTRQQGPVPYTSSVPVQAQNTGRQHFNHSPQSYSRHSQNPYGMEAQGHVLYNRSLTPPLPQFDSYRGTVERHNTYYNL